MITPLSMAMTQPLIRKSLLHVVRCDYRFSAAIFALGRTITPLLAVEAVKGQPRLMSIAAADITTILSFPFSLNGTITPGCCLRRLVNNGIAGAKKLSTKQSACTPVMVSDF